MSSTGFLEYHSRSARDGALSVELPRQGDWLIPTRPGS